MTSREVPEEWRGMTVTQMEVTLRTQLYSEEGKRIMEAQKQTAATPVLDLNELERLLAEATPGEHCTVHDGWAIRKLRETADALIAEVRELRAETAKAISTAQRYGSEHAKMEELLCGLGDRHVAGWQESGDIPEGIDRLIAELRADKERLDKLEAAINDCHWGKKSWIFHLRINKLEIVCEHPGQEWGPWASGGITHATARAAIDAAKGGSDATS